MITLLAGMIVAVFLLPEASATFTSAVNAPSTIAASSVFPGQPKLIKDKGPVFYHRMDDLQTSVSGAAAADEMSSTAGAYGPPTIGPSLWWRFDEAAGATSFSDVSGAVNTASANGTVTAGQAGPMGGAVTLGNGSYLSSQGSPFRADRGFTMSVWFNIGSVVPTTNRLAVLSMTGGSAGTPNDRSDAMITAEPPANCASANPCWAFVMAGDPQNTSVAFDVARSTSAVTANTWFHLTAVFDPASAPGMSLYINGTLEGTKTHTVPADAATNAGLVAGRYRDVSYLGATAGTAQIGETRTWRRPLLATEVAQLTVRPTARYAFNEAAGTSTTYTTTAASTGPPGAVSRSAPLTAAGGAVLATGRERNAFTSASAGGTLTGPSAQLTTTNSFTVAAWVKLTDSTVDRIFFSANYGAGTVLSLGYSSNKWMMGVLTGLFNVTATSDVTPAVVNQWVHLVAMYDKFNGLLRLYVDGVPQNPVSLGGSTVSTADDVVVVGARRVLGVFTDPWPGQVDDLRLYNGYPLATSAATTAGTLQTFVNLQNPGLSAEVPGGLQGSTKTGHAGSTAVAFGGTGNAYDNKYASATATTAFTVECLIRVGPGQNGVIAGFTATSTGLGSGTSDRLLYVDSAGKVRFGVLQSGSPVTVVSAASVDDGAWHHITAGVGPITGSGALAAGGLRLSLDGTVTSTNTVTAAAATTGVWRWGGAPLTGWPSAPANPYLTGTLDELAVYDKQLTDQDDLWRVYGNY